MTVRASGLAVLVVWASATGAAGASTAASASSTAPARSPPTRAADAGGVSMAGPSPGRVVVHDAFPSRHVAPRRVVVWLPAGYDGSDERYAVLYMHDGQNLFDPATSMGGEPWAVDRHLDALARAHRARPTIVVGVWNTDQRSREYAPAAPLATLPAPVVAEAGLGEIPLLSDNYVEFLTQELKPFVDARYRTRPGRDDTVVMGSSMGGLISLYALARRPDVFGAAGCLSTHWPITVNPDFLQRPGDPRVERLAQAYLDWLRVNLPAAGTHRLYFDHGTEHLDSLYAPFQRRMDAVLADRGYRRDVDAMSRVFPGTTHDERAWRARLDLPLAFLLRP